MYAGQKKVAKDIERKVKNHKPKSDKKKAYKKASYYLRLTKKQNP